MHFNTSNAVLGWPSRPPAPPHLGIEIITTLMAGGARNKKKTRRAVRSDLILLCLFFPNKVTERGWMDRSLQRVTQTREHLPLPLPLRHNTHTHTHTPRPSPAPEGTTMWCRVMCTTHNTVQQYCITPHTSYLPPHASPPTPHASPLQGSFRARSQRLLGSVLRRRHP